jgi:hypothetical protein
MKVANEKEDYIRERKMSTTTKHWENLQKREKLLHMYKAKYVFFANKLIR